MKDNKLVEHLPNSSYDLLSEFVGYRIFLGNQIYDMPKDRMDALELIASYYHKSPFNVTKQDMKDCLTYDEEGYVTYTDDFKNFLKKRINMKKDSKTYKIIITDDSLAKDSWHDLWRKYATPAINKMGNTYTDKSKAEYDRICKIETDKIEQLYQRHKDEYDWDVFYQKWHENDDNYDENGNPIDDSEENPKEEISEEVKLRRKNARLMNKVISSMTNENAYYGGWCYSWVDEGDVNDGYYDEKEDYKDLKDSFKRIYKRYHKDGLYNPDEETIKFAYEWDKKLRLNPIEIVRSHR